MADKPDHDKPDVKRRNFLYALGAGAGVCATGTQATASLRSLVANMSYDAPTTIKLGPPQLTTAAQKVSEEQVARARE